MSFRPAIIAAAGAALAGCAVAQIDVDVYKGPLANHKDVQTEQLAAMAVGARPLLIRLLGDVTKDTAIDFQGGDYRTICDLEDTRLHNIRVPSVAKVRDVCDVLSLYEDRPVRLGSDLLSEAEAAFARGRAAYEILYPDGGTETQLRLRLRLEEVGRTKEREGERPQEDERVLERRQDREAVRPEEYVKGLAQAYSDFLLPPAGGTSRQWSKIFDAIRQLDVALLDGIDRDRLPNLDDPSLFGSNTAFRILRNETFLRSQSTLLFPEDNVTQRDFVREIKRIASSYTDARQALADLLRIALRALSVADELDFRSTAVQKQFVSGIAALVVQLVEPLHLRLALDDPEQSRPIQRLRRRLSGDLMLDSPGTVDSKSVYDRSGGISNALRDAIVDDPLDTSRALMDANRRFTSSQQISLSPGTQIEANLKQRFDEPDRRIYGLARSPMSFNGENGNGAISPPQFVSVGTTLIKLLRSGRSFLLGRLNDGLYTFIEEYLNTSFQNPLPSGSKCGPKSHCDLDRKRRNLLNALVRFGEKVRFLANNQTWFRISGEAGESRADDSEQGPKDRAYIGVLQTIGNTVQVHADALLQEETHEQALIAGKEAEIRAIKEVYQRGSGGAFDRLLDGVRSQKNAVVRDLVELRKLTSASNAAHRAAAKAASDAAVALSKLPQPVTITKPEMLKEIMAVWRSLGNLPEALDNDGAPNRDEEDLRALRAIDKHEKDAEVVVGDFYGKIEEVLNGELSHASQNNQQERVNRLILAISALGEPEFKNAVTKDVESKADIRKKIESELRLQYEKEKQPFLEKQAANAEKSKNIRTAQATLNALRQDEAAKSAEAMRDSADVAAAEARQRAFEDAETAMLQRRGAVLQAVDAAGTGATGGAVRAQLLSSFYEDKKNETGAATPDQAKIAALDNAIKIVGDLPAPTGVPANIGQDAANTKEVFDELVSVLRLRHIQQIEIAGERESAKSAEALAEAYRQRASMVYLRPAMAYLRTSFTASTLQDNRLAWKNMLAEHAVRSSVPFFPQHFEEKEAEITTEIDKQFWQNINRVRVAGAGRTNFVMVKDDVGNWYVGRYSADPQDIIRAAQSLAMFNLSSQLNTDLLSRTPGQDGGGTGQPADAQRSTLERVFDDYQGTYEQSTAAHFVAVKNAISDGDAGLVTRVRAEWSKVPNRETLDEDSGTLEDALTTAENGLATARQAMASDSGAADVSTDLRAQRPAKIVDALQAVRRFHQALQDAIASLPLTERHRQDLEDQKIMTAEKKVELTHAEARLEAAEKAQSDSERAAASANEEQADAANQNVREKVAASDAARNKRNTAKEEFDKAEVRVTDLKRTLARAEAAKMALRAKITAVAEPLLRDHLRKRQTANAQLEQAITFIGNAVRASDTSGAQQTAPAAGPPPDEDGTPTR